MNNSNIEEKLKEFLQRIDDYINNKNLGTSNFHKELKEAESFSGQELRDLSQEDCFNYGFLLYNYVDYLIGERAKQQNVISFCEEFINKIVARDFMDVEKFYTTKEIKVAMITKDNHVAQRLIEFKHIAESRIRSLEGREFNIRKKAECLLEKGKRK